MTGLSAAVAPEPAKYVWAALNHLRNNNYRPDGVVSAFADDAVAWSNTRRGVTGLPVRPPADGYREKVVLPPELLASQRAWLDAASDDERATYIPELARLVAVRTEHAEHLSSQPIVDVVVAALTARLRAVAGSPAVLYDPVCGTGGMLASAAVALRSAGMAPSLYGQDINRAAVFVAQAGLAVGEWDGRIVAGDCLADDGLAEVRFGFAVAEPPYGLGWRREADTVRARHEAGGFPGGLPAQSDATWLFVQHLVEKMRPESEGGARAVVLVAPGALRDRGAERVRRWVLDEDLLEAIIGLPDGLSPNTGIRLNALVLTNRRPEQRRGQVQVVNLRSAFENRPLGRLTRRALRADAIDLLRHALSTVKPGPISRTVPTERFMERAVTITSTADGGAAVTWRLPLSLADDPTAFVAKHVQAPPSEVADSGSDAACVLDVDGIFGGEVEQIDSWVRERRWQCTRLAALAQTPLYVPSPSSAERAAALAELPPGKQVMLPIEPGHPAVHGDPASAPLDRRFLAFTCPNQVDADFLVGYLNSRNGTVARRAALEPISGTTSPRTISKAAAEAFLAALVLPVPDKRTQHQLVDADSTVQTAIRSAERAAEELWRTPEKHGEIARRVARPSAAGSLADWAQELPYPLATALWAAETKRGNEDARNRQLFHFWEAASAFHGTILLSALEQDPTLRDAEMATISATLAAAGLTMERASLGAWLILTQRLGSQFRAMLDNEDPDERARVQTLFAGAPDELIRALCGTEIAKILGRVTQRRNDWSGHGGAVSDRAMAERNAWLTEQIEAFRDVIDGAWASAPLVRAGQMSFEDGVYRHDVERVMGLNTPFLTQTVTVGTPMERGQLYVVTDGAQHGLRVEQFVQLRASPASAQYACYFYNRLVGEQSRLVSYHLGGDGELLEVLPGLSSLVAGFNIRVPEPVADSGEPSQE